MPTDTATIGLRGRYDFVSVRYKNHENQNSA